CAHPQRILTVVVVGAFGQRMDEDVQAVTVQHQPRHDFLELCSLEDDVELRNRVRASRFIAEGPRLYGESFDDCVPQTLGGLPSRGIIIDMSVIAFDFCHSRSPLVFTRYPTPNCREYSPFSGPSARPARGARCGPRAYRTELVPECGLV